MIKSILIASAIILNSAPAFSQTITKNPTTFGLSQDRPPSIALASVDVPSAIYCRNRARSKFFELSARNMSEEDNNSQWGLIGNIQAIVWCRGTQAVIGVAGSNWTSVSELREEIKRAF
jgi:hypothetical protein